MSQPRGSASRPKISRIQDPIQDLSVDRSSGSKTWKTQYVPRSMAYAPQTSIAWKASTWSAAWCVWPHAKIWWKQKGYQMMLYWRSMIVCWRQTWLFCFQLILSMIVLMCMSKLSFSISDSSHRLWVLVVTSLLFPTLTLTPSKFTCMFRTLQGLKNMQTSSFRCSRHTRVIIMILSRFI